MTTLHDVEQFVEDHQDVSDVGRPASDDLIEKAERFLQVRFPRDYRAFLKRWGTLAVGPLEFYGITGDAFESSSIPNAIWFTHVKRQQLGLPNQLVILYDNNGVEYYCLDTSDVEKSPVVIWDVRSRKVGATKAESLFDFILSESADLV